MAQRIFTLILLLCSTSVFAGLFDAPGRSQFVPADQAFAFDFQQNQHELNLSWQIKDGYYLYRKQIHITPEQAKIADVQLPPGVWHEDEFYGKSEIYRDKLTLPVTIDQASAGATLTVTYQGCAEAGFCYPPETKIVPLSAVIASKNAPQPAPAQQQQTDAQLPFSALWALLIGIGIAFTPCVLPMYPLISGIVLGGKQRHSTARALLLTFIYVQGMALTYTALGLVLYIAQSGNMWLGGGTLYLYALGMGLPLMLITVFGNRLLPKSGPWMEQVKTAFGFVILALPVFLLERVIGDVWGLRLWSVLSVAFFGWAFITSLQAKRGWMRIVQIILLAAALVSVRPLQDWAFGATHTAQTQAHLNFTQIKTVDELNQALIEAKGKPVMLDLYADWCVACKEFEKYTFSDPQVQKTLADTVLLQANVTANDAQDVALLKHLNVLGLPTILFFDTQGNEQPNARVTGYMDATTFDAHLRDRQP